jgi:arylsulfatase A-like enzyme
MKLLSIVLSSFVILHSSLAAERPNILWLTSEDHGPHMGCYGDTFATTPNVDALAAKGMLFKHAWSNGSRVCAPRARRSSRACIHPRPVASTCAA